MSTLSEYRPTICVAAVDHDPKGTHAEFYKPATEVLENWYDVLLVDFTINTHPDTIQAARDYGWRGKTADLSIGQNRFSALRSALETNCDFIHLFDGDRLLYAATKGPDDLLNFGTATPLYDFLIAGATPSAIATHQKSMTGWESVKSWALGRALGIDGDIANRGCFSFSKEFAQFTVQYPPAPEDETDGIFPLLAIAYNKYQREKNIDNGRQSWGYREYDKAFRYEDWLFEKGVTQEESAQRKNTYVDFIHRATSVIRILYNMRSIDERFNLNLLTDEERTVFDEMNQRLLEELQRSSSV